MDGASAAEYLSARLSESGGCSVGGQTGAGGRGWGKVLGGVAPDKGEGGWNCRVHSGQGPSSLQKALSH